MTSRWVCLASALLALSVAGAKPKDNKGAAAAEAKSKAKAPEAPGVEKAKQLFEWAQRLYKQARYAEAIAKFEEAYSERPHPVIYFNIGKCWEQLGDIGKAMRAYKDYLRLAPDAKDRELVSDAISNLERRLKESGLQQVMVFADPSSARIEVDGKALGTAPASVELTAGNHRLVVRADGYETVERSFVVTSGRSTEMNINLRANNSPPVAPPPLVTAGPADAPKKDTQTLAPGAGGPAGSAVGQSPPVVSSAPKSGKRTWTWVAGGVAVAGAGAGVGLGLIAQGKANELTSKPHDRATGDALVASAQGYGAGATAAYAVAGTALVTGVVLFFVEGR